MSLREIFDEISVILKVEIADDSRGNHNYEESQTDEKDDFLLFICIVRISTREMKSL